LGESKTKKRSGWVYLRRSASVSREGYSTPGAKSKGGSCKKGRAGNKGIECVGTKRGEAEEKAERRGE